VSGGKGFWWANKVTAAIYGGQPFVPPPVLYVALFLVEPGPAGGGLEVNAASYARVAVPNDPDHWAAPMGGSTSNLQDIVFPDATTDWGTITAFAIFDAAVKGNQVGWAPFHDTYIILRGSKSRFPVGGFVVQEQ